MELVWKVCAVGVLCAVAVWILKPLRGEFAALLGVGGGILILLALLPALSDVMEDTVSLFEGSEIGRYADVMLRAMGIALLTRICSDVCKDTGEGAVAGGVELAGKVAILTLCLPMIREILGYAAQILQKTDGG